MLKCFQNIFSAQLLRLLCLIILVFSLTDIAVGQTKSKDKLQKDKKRLEKEINETNNLLKQTQKSTKISLTQLVILNSKISMREELINAISGEIGTLSQKIANNQMLIGELGKDLERLKEEYAQMVYYAYKNHNTYSSLLFVFSANDINQAYKRLKYLQQYGDYRKKQAEMILKTKESLTFRILELRGQKIEKDQLLTREEIEKNELAQEKQEKNKYIAQLKSKEQDLLKQKKKKESALSELNRAIDRVIQEEIRLQAERNKKKREKERTQAKADKKDKAGKRSSASSESEALPKKLELTNEEQTLSNSFVGNKGRLPWPSDRGMITSSFGTHPHPVLQGIMVDNSGIDISLPQGSVAKSVFEGKVTGVVNIMGTMAVIIRHGEYLSVYSNLSRVYVRNGDVVRTKQLLGVISDGDREGKSELHFEIRKGNVALNPASWISGAR